MKSINVRDFQKKIRECIEAAQKERVVVTRHGRPAVILIGVEGQDWEDIMYQTSPAFWKMIEARRKERPIPLGEMRRRLGLPSKRSRARR